MSKRIRLNVGGTYFETSQENLLAVPYFEALLLRWQDEDKDIFIDRSSIGFDHVLNLLRNPNYLFPRQYAAELDYYGVEYEFPVDSLEELKKGIQKEMHEMKDFILKESDRKSNSRPYCYDECSSCNKKIICYSCKKCARCCHCKCISMSCDRKIRCFKCRFCYDCDQCKCFERPCDKSLACGQCGSCNAHCRC